MLEDQYKEVMSDEIKKRMDSKEWNHRIASNVLQKKRQTKKRLLYSTSLSSLAAAAILVILFIFGIDKKPEQNPYDRFISNQLKGTHNEVFINDYELTSSYIKSEDIILLDETDSLIDNTLAMR